RIGEDEIDGRLLQPRHHRDAIALDHRTQLFDSIPHDLPHAPESAEDAPPESRGQYDCRVKDLRETFRVHFENVSRSAALFGGRLIEIEAHLAGGEAAAVMRGEAEAQH